MNGTTLNETDISEILSCLNKEQAIIMIPSTILVIITMSVGLIGNLITCYVYGFQLKMTPTYFFVVMLAVVDLMTCAIITPERIFQNVFPMMITSDVLCKLHMGLSVFTGFCTCGFLLVIAVDRYRRMCRPLKSQITMNGAKIITLVIYVIAATQGSTVTIYYGSVRKPTMYPNVFSQSCSATIIHYQLFFFISYFFVATFTIILLIGLYSVVLYTMKKIVDESKIASKTAQSETGNHLKADPTTICSNSQPISTTSGNINTLTKVENSKAEKILSIRSLPRFLSSAEILIDDSEHSVACRELVRNKSNIRSPKQAEDYKRRLNRTTVTMMMITAVFIVASIPNVSAMIANGFMKDDQKIGTTAAIFYWLARHAFYITTSLNPVIYGFRNESFKAKVRQLFCKFK